MAQVILTQTNRKILPQNPYPITVPVIPSIRHDDLIIFRDSLDNLAIFKIIKSIPIRYMVNFQKLHITIEPYHKIVGENDNYQIIYEFDIFPPHKLKVEN